VVDRAEVDVPGDRAALGPLEVDLRDTVVFEDGDALLAHVDRDEQLTLRRRERRPARGGTAPRRRAWRALRLALLLLRLVGLLGLLGFRRRRRLRLRRCLRGVGLVGSRLASSTSTAAPAASVLVGLSVRVAGAAAADGACSPSLFRFRRNRENGNEGLLVRRARK